MKNLKIIVLKPVCLVESSRYQRTISALYKELIENRILMNEKQAKIFRPTLKELESLDLSSKEVEEISKDSIVCIEVKDVNNKVPIIVEKLNKKFSCSLENWFKFFDKEDELKKIRSWDCKAILSNGRV